MVRFLGSRFSVENELSRILGSVRSTEVVSYEYLSMMYSSKVKGVNDKERLLFGSRLTSLCAFMINLFFVLVLFLVFSLYTLVVIFNIVGYY